WGATSNRCSAEPLSSTVNAYEVSFWTVNTVRPYEALTRRSIVGAGRAVYRPLFTTSAISCAALTPVLAKDGRVKILNFALGKIMQPVPPTLPHPVRRYLAEL